MSVKVSLRVRNVPRKPIIYLCEHCLAPVIQSCSSPVKWAHGVADWAACGKFSHSPLPTLNASKDAAETQYDAEAAEWAFERDRLLVEIDAERKRADFFLHYLDLVNAGQTLTSDEWDLVDETIRREKGTESNRIWGAF